MARFSVAQTDTDNEDQTIADINWEEESYQQGCACGREQARLSLEGVFEVCHQAVSLRTMR